MQEAFLRGLKSAQAEHPESELLQRLVADQERLLAGPQEGDLPDDAASLWPMRPLD
jgi:hypothetical protein